MKKSVFALALVFILVGCKAKKGLVEANASDDLATQNIIQNHYDVKKDFSTAYIRANAKYKDKNQSLSFSAEIRIKKNEMILVSIRFLGITMAKGLITPTEVKYYEKNGGKFFEGDYTTLSKRGRKLNLESLLDSKDTDFDYICLDSTGVQTYTGNEWLENKHGKQYIRRTWRKLHIATSNNGIITGTKTTFHNKDDRSQVEELLKNVKAKEVLADTGYDGENIYQTIRAK
jgi:hypothetical protein